MFIPTLLFIAAGLSVGVRLLLPRVHGPSPLRGPRPLPHGGDAVQVSHLRKGLPRQQEDETPRWPTHKVTEKLDRCYCKDYTAHLALFAIVAKIMKMITRQIT